MNTTATMIESTVVLVGHLHQPGLPRDIDITCFGHESQIQLTYWKKYRIDSYHYSIVFMMLTEKLVGRKQLSFSFQLEANVFHLCWPTFLSRSSFAHVIYFLWFTRLSRATSPESDTLIIHCKERLYFLSQWLIEITKRIAMNGVDQFSLEKISTRVIIPFFPSTREGKQLPFY